MDLRKLLFLLGSVLFFDVPVAQTMDQGEAAPQQQLCLMDEPSEYTSPEWLPKFTEYCEQKGRQKQRLEKEENYKSSCTRFVKDIPSLSIGYGLLKKDKNIGIPALQLESEIYDTLANLGVSIKIINGYVQGFDTRENTFTLPATNVFIPHISYIIQWEKDKFPELVPGGIPCTPKGQRIVFMSGWRAEETDNKIEQFYNYVYKKEEEPEVRIYRGHTVENKCIPSILYKATNDLDIFKGPYLEKLVEEMKENFPFTIGAPNKILKIKNIIYCAFEFLGFLLRNDWEKLFTLRQDTTRKLLEEFPSGEKIQILEESSEEDSKEKRFIKKYFTSALQEHRLKFLKAAIQRIEKARGHLEEEDCSLLRNISHYMKASLFPEELKDIEKAKKLWNIIKFLSNNITCPKRGGQSGYFITVKGNLKKYAHSDFKEDHTEPFFVKLMRGCSELLTQNLQKIVEANGEHFVEGNSPRFLGIVIDGFSWLDPCWGCSNFLHTNPIWKEALDLTRDDIQSKGFVLPLLQMDSLFRIVSQEQYMDTPKDLIQAGGGNNYVASGWDYRVLSGLRYTLATRYPQKEKEFRRDKVFEKIPNAITRLALYKPLGFWQEHLPLCIVILRPSIREFAVNAIDILSVRFPNNKVIRIKKIETAFSHKKFEDICHLAKPLLEVPLELSGKEKELFDILMTECDSSNCHNFLKTFFAKACLEQARYFFKNNKIDEGWQHLADFAKFGLILEREEFNFDEANFHKIASHIINYWEKEWKPVKKDVRDSPAKEDKLNTEDAIKMLWEIAYKEEYSSALENDHISILRELLEKSKLSPPPFVRDLLNSQNSPETTTLS